MQPTSLVFVLLLAGFVAASPAAPVELLTPQEAAQPDLPVVKDPVTGKFALAGDKAPVAGAPAILFDTPSPGAPVVTPFPVKIRFVPGSDAKIALNTLKIEVLKIVPISLLSKVKPYLTASGITVPEVQFPTGQFNIRVAISDTKGREGVVQGTWVIK
jgi:hypothetical protein